MTDTQMPIGTSRTDNPHDISYPPAADKRGSTRINHKRRPYYLGPYDSPASYIMFGLWKHQLLESGEPPSCKDLRPIVQNLLSDQSIAVPVSRRGYWIATISVLLSTVLVFAFIWTIEILSRDSVPHVDNVVLSKTETEIIRGYRAQQLGIGQNAIDLGESIATLMVEFKEEDPINGIRHISEKSF